MQAGRRALKEVQNRNAQRQTTSEVSEGMLRIVGLAAGAAALVAPGAQTPARAPALQAKNVLFGDESRAQLVAGINAVADAVKVRRSAAAITSSVAASIVNSERTRRSRSGPRAATSC